MALLMNSHNAFSIAYCALRDPVKAINQLYPSSTHHKSIVKKIAEDSRKEVKKLLPFTIHFNELGKHTQYIIFDEDTALGYIHTRTENSRWGLAEFAWAINLDSTIKGIYFQRCRHLSCNNQFANFINAKFRNKDLQDLTRIYKTIDASYTHSDYKAFGVKKPFIKTVLASAIKALAASNALWVNNTTYTLHNTDQKNNMPLSHNIDH